MIVFGITGGSGSGKTSVSKMLEKLGVHIIDTDVIAHEIVAPNSECLNELVDYFGDSILNDDKTLNRKKLASIAFSDKQKTVALSNITHKYIKAEVVKDINTTDAELVGIDGAVIIGSNVEPLCEFIVSVIADKQSRITRIKTRDNITDEQAIQRINAQNDDEFYKENSMYIIYNNGDIAQLESDVVGLFNKIKGIVLSKIFKAFLVLLAIFVAVLGILGGYQTSQKFKYPVAYADYIVKYSKANDLDPFLVMAVIKVESNFVPEAHSGVAGGLMQLTEETAEWNAKELGITTEYDYMDPETNIRFGCHYLRHLIDVYGNIDTALAAYNGGMGNVYSWLNDSRYSDDGVTLKYIPFSETRNYVVKVNSSWKHYKEMYQ